MEISQIRRRPLVSNHYFGLTELFGLFLLEVRVGESAADEQQAKAVVLGVAEPVGDAAVELDERLNLLCLSSGAGSVLGGGVEVAVDLAGEVALELSSVAFLKFVDGSPS